MEKPPGSSNTPPSADQPPPGDRKATATALPASSGTPGSARANTLSLSASTDPKSTNKQEHARRQSGLFSWKAGNLRFWESSAGSREKAAKEKEDALRVEAERASKPHPVPPLRLDSVRPKKKAGEGRLTAFLNWISLRGYVVENHTVLTEDSYILNVQRIIGSTGEDLTLPRKPKPVVFLQHGLMDCAVSWVINGSNSIGFGLVERGYDVWLGNSRGNKFAKQHKDLTKSSAEFWAFDWDQMAKYDLPACFAYIKKTTGVPKLTYIGHSQGWVKHQYSKMLSYMRTMKTDAILDAFGAKSFNTPSVFNTIFPGVTKLTPNMINLGVVRMMMNAMVGFSEDNFDAAVLHDWLTFMPGGTSVRNLMHWSQATRHGDFMAYDYGKEALNMKWYGQKTPVVVPSSLLLAALSLSYQTHLYVLDLERGCFSVLSELQYDPSKLEVPTAIFAGGADKLVHPNDLHVLLLKLKNIILVVEDEKYGHLDFLWGKDAKEKYHGVVYEILEHRNVLSDVAAPSPATPLPPKAVAETAHKHPSSHHHHHHHHYHHEVTSPTKPRAKSDGDLPYNAPSEYLLSADQAGQAGKRKSDGKQAEEDRGHAAQLLSHLESEDAAQGPLLQRKHPSNVHILLQEVRRLRAENERWQNQYMALERAALSILHEMLDRGSPHYEFAFAQMKKAVPELKEANVRAVILQEQ